ncbi:unnamed protein product [Rangifer tarandus platyrhynchus]|uniref:Uncharacterized protein n=1 Tax=Rangifer tarandus platyrhynchus TaxID=3082113 RepID=A0ABN8ZG28_RANTA|nr:unnamed protein product [Rangifer tarandus platyrhynchus]
MYSYKIPQNFYFFLETLPDALPVRQGSGHVGFLPSVLRWVSCMALILCPPTHGPQALQLPWWPGAAGRLLSSLLFCSTKLISAHASSLENSFFPSPPAKVVCDS